MPKKVAKKAATSGQSTKLRRSARLLRSDEAGATKRAPSLVPILAPPKRRKPKLKSKPIVVEGFAGVIKIPNPDNWFKSPINLRNAESIYSTVDGVTAALARAIVAERDRGGMFSTWEDFAERMKGERISAKNMKVFQQQMILITEEAPPEPYEPPPHHHEVIINRPLERTPEEEEALAKEIKESWERKQKKRAEETAELLNGKNKKQKSKRSYSPKLLCKF